MEKTKRGSHDQTHRKRPGLPGAEVGSGFAGLWPQAASENSRVMASRSARNLVRFIGHPILSEDCFHALGRAERKKVPAAKKIPARSCATGREVL